jgi:hypothetical protein
MDFSQELKDCSKAANARRNELAHSLLARTGYDDGD